VNSNNPKLPGGPDCQAAMITLVFAARLFSLSNAPRPPQNRHPKQKFFAHDLLKRFNENG
jgi:hypothetical protein